MSYILKMLLSIIATLVVSYLCFVQSASQHCTATSGSPGNCIPLHECKELFSIVKKINVTTEEVASLRNLACGFTRDKVPKVCCEKEARVRRETRNKKAEREKREILVQTSCFTPDSQPGKCVALRDCPYISNLVTPHSSKAAIAFVRSSICQGLEERSVCCGETAPTITGETPSKEHASCTLTHEPPDPQSGCCGIESLSGDKIIGGDDAAIDQYPWMVLIEYYKGEEPKLLCGGGLISGRYVLTAAHCVVGKIFESGTPTNVRLGEHDSSNDPKEPDCTPVSGGGEDCNKGILVIPIEQIIAHKEYSDRRNDIALLRLARLAPFADFIRPICLPQTDISQSDLPDLRFFVAGWGTTKDAMFSNIKQYVDVPYISDCQPAYNVKRRMIELWDGQICAGSVEDEDSCKGDSGGPLMYQNGKAFEAVGLVSYGPQRCGTKGVPGVYTKVYKYLPWIKENIKP